jgi:DnaJ-domain-containing protein 1
MLVVVEEDVEAIDEVNAAQRLESRLEFIEDRFEEFESEIRQRPRRRRNKINMFNFFKAAAGGGGDPMAPAGEVRSAIQAYEILNVEFGASLSVVTRAFRERAKKLHPDSRKGDRSSEPELRKIIEAYQYLKTEYFGTGGEHSDSRPL